MTEISKTVDHALRLLTVLGEEGPRSSAALARETGLNRTVVHRLLITMHGRGFVARTDDGYMPGVTLLRLAEQVRPQLRVAARLAMTKLAREAHETVVINTPDGDETVILDQAVAARNLVRVHHDVGSRHPLEAGASGRALLAFLDASTADQVIDRQKDPAGLRAQLQLIRKLGYAVSHDELQDGVHGIAVPVFDADGAPVASLALLVPVTRATDMKTFLPGLLQASTEIAEKLQMKSGY